MTLDLERLRGLRQAAETSHEREFDAFRSWAAYRKALVDDAPALITALESAQARIAELEGERDRAHEAHRIAFEQAMANGISGTSAFARSVLEGQGDG